MPKRITINSIRSSLEEDGFVLLSSTDFKNAYSKIRIKCGKGHESDIIWNNWQQRRRCPTCSNIERSRKVQLVWKSGEFRRWMVGENAFWYGKRFKEQHKAKLSKAAIKRLSNKEYRKKWARALAQKPNKPEKLLNSLLYHLFPGEYKYVGDFKFWVDGKNPDFVNVNGQKKLIELFGDYWHRNDDPKERINHFKQYGFDTLVIWESELRNIGSVEEKLKEFHYGNRI
jgi:G:T-mismatch repair DNA endonuclease (very short patch repair protein)